MVSFQETLSSDATTVATSAQQVSAETPQLSDTELLSKISKSKKKGRLTKDAKDEDKQAVTVTADVYWKIFVASGSFKLLVPFVLTIFAFTQLQVKSEKGIKHWANKIAKDQHDEFFSSCVQIFGVTTITAVLIIIKMRLKLQMKTQSSVKFFTEMLDRVMEAPINLYFDITPIGQIQSKFTKDLNAVEGQFFDMLQNFLTPSFKLFTTFMLLVESFPKILVLFAILVFFLLRIHFSLKKPRREAMRNSRGTHVPIIT